MSVLIKEVVKEVKFYITEDGKEFNSLSEAKEWNVKVALAKYLNRSGVYFELDYTDVTDAEDFNEETFKGLKAMAKIFKENGLLD